jgi:hypothetical protein
VSLTTTETLGAVMADRQQPPSGDEQQRPSSETVRLAADLVEMARVVCFNRRTSSGRRLKLTEYLDGLLRGQITKDFEATQQEPKKKGGRTAPG